MDLVARIETKRGELQKAAESADAIAKSFLGATAASFRDQALPIAKAIGGRQQDASLKLGKDGIESLVAKIKEFASKAEEIVFKRVYNRNAWYHLRVLNGIASSSDKYSGGRPFVTIRGVPHGANDLAVQIIECFDGLAVILREAGFNPDLSSRSNDMTPHALISDQYKWSDEMKALYEKYNQAHGRLRGVEDELRQLESKKKQSDASLLWDSAT